MPDKNRKITEEYKEMTAALGGRNYDELYQLYQICENSFVEGYCLMQDALRCDDEDRKCELIVRRFECYKIATIFTQLFLEAVIYDYGVTNLSATYIKQYVDRLNFISKWVVIPKLVTGKDFPRDSEAFQLLNVLKKYRNDIIHFKTKKYDEKHIEKEMRYFFENRMTPDSCFECMGESLIELSKLGKDKWLLFEWGFIKNLINKEYKEIIAKLKEVSKLKRWHNIRDLRY